MSFLDVPDHFQSFGVGQIAGGRVETEYIRLGVEAGSAKFSFKSELMKEKYLIKSFFYELIKKYSFIFFKNHIFLLKTNNNNKKPVNNPLGDISDQFGHNSDKAGSRVEGGLVGRRPARHKRRHKATSFFYHFDLKTKEKDHFKAIIFQKSLSIYLE